MLHLGESLRKGLRGHHGINSFEGRFGSVAENKFTTNPGLTPNPATKPVSSLRVNVALLE
jgi:hypothetical protein